MWLKKQFLNDNHLTRPIGDNVMTDEPKPPTLKIMAASLVSGQKYKAYAVYDGETLIVTQVKPIPWTDIFWKSSLIAEIKERTGNGFAVLIEEKTEHVSQHGTKYLLDELWDGRTNFCDAMDWYFALQATGNLLFHKGCEQYKIYMGGEGQRVEKKTDDKGRTIYHVDWNAFHGGYRAILLCVVAATTEPVSLRYLKAMFGPPDDPDSLDPMRAFRAITVEHDKTRQALWDEFDKNRR
jgi:hypothetical protein